MRDAARYILAAFMLFAGIGHFLATDTFAAQVPSWMPFPVIVILVSGAIEIAFALALVLLPSHRHIVGRLLAIFFIVIFPGNVSQFVTGTDAFGLDTDLARGVRLMFQPLLVLWALWCTDAWLRTRDESRTQSAK